MKNTTKAKKVKSTATKPVKATRAAKAAIESRHISELNVKDRNYLEELLRKEVGMLTPGELAHLSARAPYLTTDERKKYGI